MRDMNPWNHEMDTFFVAILVGEGTWGKFDEKNGIKVRMGCKNGSDGLFMG
jgi:hypothetical protein